ncbi:serine/threonine-protein kinase PLK4 isoform X1 [Hydra vulgaris]|uniref:Serine/threonine-protein kinase PLK4 n=2 Tax=Hydra vulgaris TaxID=6087 RepID=T2MJ85_HYDVU|nr:serine/threonine-protein kinase PLK4 isoform X1 [Hydra vulgaris]XP_047126822.1 serine/threonine-protein kinase PLK4 isoform X1 [Hydra vulgaris]
MTPIASRDEEDSIDNYEVFELLGRGSFAVVYRAVHKPTCKEVAIKMIDKKKLQSSSMMKRVCNEVEIHCQLKHPSILEMYGSFEDSNYVYLILELCHNGELQQYLKKSPMNEEQARKTIREVIIGLLYLHSHGILHRDLSLGNILLTKNMDIKIADFGLAAKLNMPTDKHYTMCGTPNYISPEIATRSPHGLESDVWSLGCMLYTLLVGKPPFDTEGVKTTLNRVVMADYSVPKYLSFEAKDLIDKLLKKNPNDRITLSGILDHPFLLGKENFMNSYQDGLISIDSGHGTLSTNISKASSDKANSYLIRHPPSPPVKLVKSDKFEDDSIYVKRNISTQGFPSFSTETTCHRDNDRHCVSRSSCNCSSNCLHSYCWHESNDVSCKSISEHYNYQKRPLQDCSNIIVERTRENLKIFFNDKENHCYTKTDENKLSQSLDKIMEPLSTARLRPIRQKTRNAVVSILEDETVCLEFLQNRGGVDYVIEVFRISSDGIKVTVFNPNGANGVPLEDTPVSVPPSAVCHAFAGLPKKLWLKYKYADKFVRLVKMKTPKITFYSDLAKCSLMENIPPDFEATFYNGCKVSLSTDAIKIIDVNGRCNKYVHSDHSFSNSEKELLTHTRTCQQHCLTLESALRNLKCSSSYYPVVMGKRPSTGKRNKKAEARPCNALSSCAPSSPQSNTVSVSVMSFEGTLLSDIPKKLTLAKPGILPSRPKGPIRASSTSSMDRIAKTTEVIKKTFIPSAGWGSQLRNGEIDVQFNDGTQIIFNGVTVRYVNHQGDTFNYSKSDSLPETVKLKVSHLPEFIHELSKK